MKELKKRIIEGFHPAPLGSGSNNKRYKARKVVGVFETNTKISGAGFTLIELITAIAVLAVMLSAALVILNPLEQFKKSSDARRKSDLDHVRKALEIYYQDFNRYPPSFQGNLSTDGTADGVIAWGSDWAPYLDVVPKDPSSSKRYAYWTDATGQSYGLFAALDRGANDPQSCNNGAACVTANTYSLSCGAPPDYIACTYGITSPNISP